MKSKTYYPVCTTGQQGFVMISPYLKIIYVMAKVYWRIKYILAPNLEAKVYFSPKLPTWRLMCTLSPNLEAKVYSSDKVLIRVRNFVDEVTLNLSKPNQT